MPPLPKRVLAYLLCVAVVAAVTVAATVYWDGWTWDGGEGLVAVSVACGLAVALRFPMHMSQKMSQETAAVPIVVGIIALNPTLLVLAVLAGALVGESIKATARPAQVAFNSSTWVLGAAAGIGTALLFDGDASGHTQAASVLLSTLSYHLVTTLLVEGIVDLQIGAKPFFQWRERYGEPVLHEWALLTIGAVGGLVVELRPWAIPLLAAPFVLVYRSLRAHQGRLREAEAGQAQAEEERARLGEIIEATPDFVATSDLEGHVRYLNSAGRRLLGLPQSGPVPNLLMETAFGGWRSVADEASILRNWSGKAEIARPDESALPVSGVVVAHHGATGGAFFSTVARDISASKEFEAELQRLADMDALTGLQNRRRFDRELQAGLTAAGAGAPLALILFDLDGFKNVNDTLGHGAGDELLQLMAKNLRAAMGDSAIARLGGDEFAVLASVGAEAALAAAHRAIRLIESESTALTGGTGLVVVSASAGVAVFGPHGRTGDELLRRADAAMLRAKRQRRGMVLLADAA